MQNTDLAPMSTEVRDINRLVTSRKKRRGRVRDDANSMHIERWWLDKLIDILDDKGNTWNQERLAEACNVDPGTISRLVNGSTIKSPLVIPISNVLADHGLIAPIVVQPDKWLQTLVQSWDSMDETFKQSLAALVESHVKKK